MSVSEDGRESNVVTKIFNIVSTEESHEIADDSYKNADYLVQKQLKPPKRSLRSIEFSSQKWETGLATDIFFEDEIAQPVTCHYCGCEYALGNEVARFCSQCAKPIPRYSECEPEKVFTGCTGVCKNCNSFVPLDASSCPLCDIPIPQREIEQVQFSSDGQKYCDKCQKLSPIDAKNCQFCDKAFPLPVMVGQAVPPKLKPALSPQVCSSCERRKRSKDGQTFCVCT